MRRRDIGSKANLVTGLRAPPWLPELRADAVPTVDTFIRPGVSPHGSAAELPP